MNANISVLFYVKRSRPTSTGQLPIYYRVTVDGERIIDTAVQRYSHPDKWSAEGNRVKGTSPEAKSINAFLDTIKNNIYEQQQQLIRANKPVTPENLRNMILGIEKRKYMLIPIFQQHNDEMAALIDKEYSWGTLARFKTSFKHVKGYLTWKYKITDIDIHDIDHEFLTGYEFYLKSECHCGQNTVAKEMREFGKIIRICLANDWISRNPFLKYKCKTKEVERPFLSQEEINSIYLKDFRIERLNLVRDVFIFCCYTGLAHVDVQKLSRNHIGIGIDREKWIYLNRTKTETRSSIPLLPIALEILEKYRNHPQALNSNRLLPVYCNQKTNSYLKEIADLCGIQKVLTFHVARHTFATTVTLSNGVPIETVSKMLGHKNLKTTQHYAKILDQKVGYDMRQLRERLTGTTQQDAQVVNF